MFKGKWRWMFTAVIVLCLGSIAFFLKSKTEIQEPVKIYKVVPPTAKPISTKEKADLSSKYDHEGGHSYDHTHSNTSHSHAVETDTSEDGYDWRDDRTFDSTFSESDPWKQTYPEGKSTDNAHDPYPPRDWYKTEDPVLYIEYLQAQLIKQFGDIPEVHTFVAFQERRKFGIPIKDADEYLGFLKAQYSLWPKEVTLETLETLEKQIAAGEVIIFGPMEAP